MKKGRVLSLQKFSAAEFFKKNYFSLFLILAFIIGIFFGVYFLKNSLKLANYTKNYVEKYLLLRNTSSFLKILFSSFFNSLSVLFLNFFLGTSLFGVVTVPSLIIIKGTQYGSIIANIYSQYGVKGIAFNAVVFIPSTIIFIIILIFSSKISIRFSLKISSLTLNKTLPFNLSREFKSYSTKFIVFSVFILLSALLDAIVSVTLFNYFNL